MKFLYYVACIGNPQLDIKLRILKDNLEYVYHDLKHSFDVMINCYETDEAITQTISQTVSSLAYIDRCYMYKKKGILSEVFLTNPDNIHLKQYDYILFILDDVKITHLNILEMIDLKTKYNMTLCSPKIVNATHHYMTCFKENIATMNNFIEIYVLLLTPSDMDVYFNLNTIDNKWLWGVDLVLGYFNIRSGMIYKFSAEHMLPSQSNRLEAYHLMNAYLSHKTCFKTAHELHYHYKPIISFIKL
jgi:hypothetical protein